MSYSLYWAIGIQSFDKIDKAKILFYYLFQLSNDGLLIKKLKQVGTQHVFKYQQNIFTKG